MEKVIKTAFIFPPIPVRDYDWCAYCDENEDITGWGKTEDEAKQNFFKKLINEIDDIEEL